MTTTYSSMSTIRLNTWLHPKMEAITRKLHADLIRAYEAKRVEFRFEIFETFRFPDRQAHLLKQGTTKAGPWKSAHQVGLATDFVPYLTADQAVKYRPASGSAIGGWYWPAVDHESWDVLTKLAHSYGLETYSWDRPHVEHPLFEQIRKIGF